MTFYAVEQSLALKEGFIEAKYIYGKQKRGWKTRYISLYSSDEEANCSSGTLVICDKNDFENRSFIFLTDVTSLRRIQLRRRNFAFLIECKDGTQVTLKASSEKDAQKWIQVLRSALLKVDAPSFITGEVAGDNISAADENDNNILPDSFPVAVIDNQDSCDLGISAYYILKMSPLSLSLLDFRSHVTIQQWPLRQIERFSIPPTFEEDNNHMFAFHVVRDGKSETYSFFVEDALKIMEVVKEVIMRRLGQTSKDMSFETLQRIVTLKRTDAEQSSDSGSSYSLQSNASATEQDTEKCTGAESKYSEKQHILRRKPMTLSRTNAIRHRTYTGSSSSPTSHDYKHQRRAKSMNEAGVDQQDNTRENMKSLVSPASFKKLNKTPDSLRKSQFYVDLVETKDIPLRNVPYTDGYIRKKHLSMQDVPRSLEKNVGLGDHTNHIANDLDDILRPKSLTAVLHARGHSLPDTEWIIPEEITVPKTAQSKENDPNLFNDSHEVARRRISTTSNIYYDLEFSQPSETQDITPIPESKDNDKYKKNLQKFLGIPAELKDPLSAPPSLPARPKCLPQAIKKNGNDGRYSLKEAVFQTLKRNRNKENSDSIPEGNSSDEDPESDNPKISISAINVVPISSWPINSSSNDENTKTKKVELQNQLYSNVSNIYMNHDVINSGGKRDIFSETDHIYSQVPDDCCSDLKQHAKSLGDLLQEFENDPNECDDYLFSSVNDLTETRRQLSSSATSLIYENVSCLHSQFSLSSNDSYKTAKYKSSTSSTPSSSLDSIYLSMDQLQVNTDESSPVVKPLSLQSNKKSSHRIKHDYTDTENIYMPMGPPIKTHSLEPKSTYENFETRITQRL